MKKYLPKAQKGKIIKGVAQAAKKIKVPKPKLPERTTTIGRKGKAYDTNQYAKEGLRQAMEKRGVISSGDAKKAKKLLKNPNITNQDAIDMFKAALENNPAIKLYRSGGVIRGKNLRRSRKH
tara:strand:+ start:298 stop:663 length:366 start_codon:yes stop_codon:yes gene_type:complete